MAAKSDKTEHRNRNKIEMYRKVGQIANRVLALLIEKTKVGVSALEICKYGDDLIVQETDKIYEKTRAGSAGLTVNGLLYNLDSKTDVMMMDEYIIIIDVVIRVDRYYVDVAQTVILGTKKGQAVDALNCAIKCAEASFNLLRPGKNSIDLFQTLALLCEEQECRLKLRLYKIKKGGNFYFTIRKKPTEEQKVKFQPKDVIGIEINISTSNEFKIICKYVTHVGSEKITEIDPTQLSTPSARKSRAIFADEELSAETKAAQKAEKERKIRLAKIHEERQTVNPDESFETSDWGGILNEKPKVEVDPELKVHLKTHQIEGVKFMWDCTVESVTQKKNEFVLGWTGGCILAHCMGLGKTLQSIALMHTLYIHDFLKLNHFLVLAPLIVCENWTIEVNKWTGSLGRPLGCWNLQSSTDYDKRLDMCEKWAKEGGVLVLGYVLFRNLTDDNNDRKEKRMISKFKEFLLKTPDLIVADEGHQLKNSESAISKATKQIHTHRRVVLTGTPMQNNLDEYYWMVDFVRPNLLGTIKEFRNHFANPIRNGEHVDASDDNFKCMKERVYILGNRLDGIVQRKDYSYMCQYLPPKYEYVLSLQLTETQIKLYEYYLKEKSGKALFKLFQTSLLINNHPRCLVLQNKKKNRDSEERSENNSEEESDVEDFNTDNLDDDDEDVETPDPKDEDELRELSGMKIREYVIDKDGCDEYCDPSNPRDLLRRAIELFRKEIDPDNEYLEEEIEILESDKLKELILRKGGTEANVRGKSTTDLRNIAADLHRKSVMPPPDRVWYEKVMNHKNQSTFDWDKAELSFKLTALIEIINISHQLGEKLIVFSQSVITLDMIENFLLESTVTTGYDLDDESPKMPLFVGNQKWHKNIDYFRIDGDVTAPKRTTYMERFNDLGNARGRLFLISKKAGGIGTNLVGANRVIIFDASWNPTDDVQAIFRVYRLGQTKNVFVYRFVGHGTMEEKIYERQVNKTSLGLRVVDKQQVDRHFTACELKDLYKFVPKPEGERERLALPKDGLLKKIITNEKTKDWIVKYHEHDSLLEPKPEENLSESQKERALIRWPFEENQSPGAHQAMKDRAGRAAPVDYKGGRKADEIVSGVTKKSGPPAVPVNGAEAAEKFRDDNEVAVVGFVATDDAVFNAAGDSFDDVPFGILDADAAKALDVAEGKIALLKQFDDKRADFTGATNEDLIKFVGTEQLALVNEFSDKTARKISSGDDIERIIIQFVSKSDADYETIIADFTEEAKTFKGIFDFRKIRFVLVDCDVEDNKRVMDFFGNKEYVNISFAQFKAALAFVDNLFNKGRKRRSVQEATSSKKIRNNNMEDPHLDDVGGAFSAELIDAIHTVDIRGPPTGDNNLQNEVCNETRKPGRDPKRYFNYLLLDPRKTKDLSRRFRKDANLSSVDILKCFMKSIFYVGKGPDNRQKPRASSINFNPHPSHLVDSKSSFLHSQPALYGDQDEQSSPAYWCLGNYGEVLLSGSEYAEPVQPEEILKSLNSLRESDLSSAITKSYAVNAIAKLVNRLPSHLMPLNKQILARYETSMNNRNRNDRQYSYNVGVRLIDDFLAKNRHGRCKNMHETAEAIQSAFKQYINVQPQVGKWNDAQNSFSLTLDTNPLTSFVELPAELGGLCYCQFICGILRGALEMIQLETKVQIVADNLKGSSVTEIRVSFIKKLVDALPVGED